LKKGILKIPVLEVCRKLHKK